MVWVLMAYGPNNIEIPCMFWTNGETALKESIERLGEPYNKEKNCWYVYDADRQDDDEVGSVLLMSKPGMEDMDPYEFSCRSDYLKKLREITYGVPASKVFTGYYGGCGEVGSFELLEIKEGTPIINWNLD